MTLLYISHTKKVNDV